MNLQENLENLVNISKIKNEPSDWNITFSSVGNPISYKIDNGAHCNVILVESVENISPRPDLQPVNVKLSSHNGSKLPVVRKCSLTLDHKNNSFKVLFIVVDSGSAPILGLKISRHLQLIKGICRTEINSETFFLEFHDCFGEIDTDHVEVKDNVKQVVTPVCKVPHALKLKLEKTLKRMVDLDIIKPIEKPTDWVDGLVILEKPNGKFCICLNPHPFHNSIKHKHLHLSTAEKIFSEMSGAYFFSKLDASSVYWQIKVDEESSHLLAFATPLGCYHFKRLPYGIHSASEVFQWENTSIISDVPGNANSQDDIIVWGRTLAEHNERLNKVFLKIWKSGLKLNKKKGQIRLKSIVFLGNINQSQPSKNWGNHTSAITELCKWTPAILRHYHILRKVHTKSCWSDLSPSYPAKETSWI